MRGGDMVSLWERSKRRERRWERMDATVDGLLLALFALVAMGTLTVLVLSVLSMEAAQ